MKTLGLFTWILISFLITGIIESLVLSRLWLWFIAAEYGGGPSTGAWFGVSCGSWMLVSMATPNAARSCHPSPRRWTFKASVSQSVARWSMCGILVVLAWATGSMLGWSR